MPKFGTGFGDEEGEESTEKISKAMERRTKIDGLKTLYQMYNEASMDVEAILRALQGYS